MWTTLVTEYMCKCAFFCRLQNFIHLSFKQMLFKFALPFTNHQPWHLKWFGFGLYIINHP